MGTCQCQIWWGGARATPVCQILWLSPLSLLLMRHRSSENEWPAHSLWAGFSRPKDPDPSWANEWMKNSKQWGWQAAPLRPPHTLLCSPASLCLGTCCFPNSWECPSLKASLETLAPPTFPSQLPRAYIHQLLVGWVGRRGQGRGNSTMSHACMFSILSRDHTVLKEKNHVLHRKPSGAQC